MVAPSAPEVAMRRGGGGVPLAVSCAVSSALPTTSVASASSAARRAERSLTWPALERVTATWEPAELAVPYADLTDDEQEKDRVIARLALSSVRPNN
jgi:hypothetical protein